MNGMTATTRETSGGAHIARQSAADLSALAVDVRRPTHQFVH